MSAGKEKPVLGNELPQDKISTFLSMKKRRQQHLIQHLNFISAHSNSEKLKLEKLDFSQFVNLLSKVTYENMCEFNTQHRHCYCTKSILEELGVMLMTFFNYYLIIYT